MFHVEHQITQYLGLLTKWNSAIRLTGSTAAADLARHVEEARALLPFLPSGRIIDIGSGGGFPGIILAILRPKQPIVMVEPIGKKVSFLRTCRRELKLENVTVYRGRDDSYQEQADFELFDVALSQATFPPPVWFDRARALVRPGGTILALLGPNPGELPDTVVTHPAAVDGRERFVGIQVL